MESSTPIKIEKSNPIWIGEFIKSYFSTYENEKIKDSSLEKFKENLLKNQSEIIEELEFSIDSSYRRGSFGDYYSVIAEYKFLKSPLITILAFIHYKELLLEILDKNKTNGFFIEKGQFAQFFSSKELKDSNLVVRYTFENFNFAHLTAIEKFYNDDYKNFQNFIDEGKKETCGFFGVQHKSHLYSGSRRLEEEMKYTQGHSAKTENCRWDQIKELDGKIYKDAHHCDSERDELKPKKKSKGVTKKVKRSKI
jgi:hypothetical protein